MTKDEALRLALEVLQELEDTNSYWWQEVDEVTTKKIDPAITAIKAALEAKDEPVAWQDTAKHSELVAAEDWENIDPQWHWMYRPLYTAPPQRTWVGLTAQEAADCWTTNATKTWNNFEAKLKSKNT